MRADAPSTTEHPDGYEALRVQLDKLAEDYAEAREKHELALKQVEKTVREMRRCAENSRFYTERNLPAATADAVSLAERCMLLRDALEDLTATARALGMDVTPVS